MGVFSISPLEVMWSSAPPDVKLILALNYVVEILRAAEDSKAVVTLDDGKYEIVLNRLEVKDDHPL